MSWIGDRVWLDLNDDGTQDPDEPGLSQVTVEAFDASGETVLDTTVTDSNGFYALMVPIGPTNRIVATPPPRYTFSLKDQGSDVTDNDFGPGGLFLTVNQFETNLTFDAGFVTNFFVRNSSPAPHALDVSPTSLITVVFGRPPDTGTVNANSFLVRGDRFGVYSGAIDFADTTTAVFTASTSFGAGETISVHLYSAIRSLTGNRALMPFQFSFTTESEGCDAFSLSHSGQSLDPSAGRDIVVGDIDQDGDLDAVVGNSGSNTLWLNQGAGVFSHAMAAFSNRNSRGVQLGDLNGDGFLDLFVANDESEGNEVWFNTAGTGFTNSGQSLGTRNSRDVALGDVDGDGDLDAVVANENQGNRIWINDGSGAFAHNGQSFDTRRSRAIRLGDLDGDGDLDMVVANSGQANSVWSNRGDGQFFDIGSGLGSRDSRDAALADLDGDGDLDLAVANGNMVYNTIWFNDGNAGFTYSGQTLGSNTSLCVEPG
ncbi:MAG: FG-GAP-like repeat-containing protein, partial [Verrucomicrobiota bacterium]